MRRRHLLCAVPALATPWPVAVRAEPRQPVVIELFTSQSCSSCPPADALLQELATQRTDLLALSWHVTYWNRLGWRDRFSLAEATERQRRYAVTLGHGQVYTPQAVIQGTRDVVGSNRAALLSAIGAARPGEVPLSVTADAAEVGVRVGSGVVAGQLLLVGYDGRHVTPVGAGENRGRTLSHGNVVRSVRLLGPWPSAATPMRLARPEGEHIALLLQAPTGAIAGAATTA